MIKIKQVIGIELQKIKLEPGDCLFVKVDINQFDIDEANRIFQMVKDLVPYNITVIGYPSPGVELQVVRQL